MQRVKRSTAIAVLPADPVGGTPGFFATPDPGGVPATVPGYEWYNNVQEEICYLIEANGGTLSGSDRTQIYQSVKKMVQSAQRAVIVNNAVFAPAVTGTGKAVYWDSANSRFDLALADGSAKQNCVGFADVANANVYAFGDAVLFSGLTPGARYYLDGTTAGAITANAPTNVVFVGIAKTATEVFVDVDTQSATTTAAIQGTFKNLIGWADGVSSIVGYWLDEHIVEDNAGSFKTGRNISLSINLATAGANGLDTGTVAASSWYSTWGIYNPTTNTWAGIAALCPVLTGSTSAASAVVTGLSSTASMRTGMPVAGGSFPAGSVIKTVDSSSQITLTQKAVSTGATVPLCFLYDPVMPSGYTHKARVGYGRTDATANKFPLSFVQLGRTVQYKPAAASNLTAYPILASGLQGTLTSTAFTPVAVAVANFCPPTAGKIQALVYQFAALCVALAPSTQFSGFMQTNPPPLLLDGGASQAFVVQGTMLLESANVYYASTAAGSNAQIIGWEDNL